MRRLSTPRSRRGRGRARPPSPAGGGPRGGGFPPAPPPRSAPGPPPPPPTRGPLPPADVGAENARLARATRPRGRVPADRRQLRALRAARPLGGLGGARARSRLDVCTVGDSGQAVLAPGAVVVIGRARARSRLDRRYRVQPAAEAPSGGAAAD